MGKNKKLLAIICTFVLLIGGASLLYNFLGDEMVPDQLIQQGSEEESNSASDSSESELTLAPNFTVYNSEEKAVQLSDYIGKPIVLNFWASWCGPCKMEMPEFNETYLEVGDEVQFLMVNVTNNYRESLGAAKNYLKMNSFSFPVLFDIDGDAENTYGIYSLPTTYFIDADGYLVAKASGMIDAETLQKGINMIR